jgi:hypothetical protein
LIRCDCRYHGYEKRGHKRRQHQFSFGLYAPFGIESEDVKILLMWPQKSSSDLIGMSHGLPRAWTQRQCCAFIIPATDREISPDVGQADHQHWCQSGLISNQSIVPMWPWLGSTIAIFFHAVPVL